MRKKLILTILILSVLVIGCDLDGNADDALCKDAAPPTAVNLSITGDLKEGAVLTGVYTFVSDKTNSSTFRWLRATDSADSFYPVAGAESQTYTLLNSDVGFYFIFEVTPVESDCHMVGTTVMSEPTSTRVRALGAPYFSDVTFTGELKRGQTLTASAVYNDDEGDSQDSGATLSQWYRDDVALPGGTALTYTLVGEDVGLNISVGLTPVAQTGVPLSGIEVQSALQGPVYPVITLDGIRNLDDDWGSGTVDNLWDTSFSGEYDILGYYITSDDINLYLAVTLAGNSNSDVARIGFYIDKDGTANGVTIDSDDKNIWTRKIRIDSTHKPDGGFFAYWNGTNRVIQTAVAESGSWSAITEYDTSANLFRNGSSTLIEFMVPLASLNLAVGDTFDYRVFTTSDSTSDAAVDTAGVGSGEEASAAGEECTMFVDGNDVQYTLN